MSMEALAMIELAKLALQIWFAVANAANLTEEQKQELLESERKRFAKNLSKPLPDV